MQPGRPRSATACTREAVTLLIVSIWWRFHDYRERGDCGSSASDAPLERAKAQRRGHDHVPLLTRRTTGLSSGRPRAQASRATARHTDQPRLWRVASWARRRDVRSVRGSLLPSSRDLRLHDDRWPTRRLRAGLERILGVAVGGAGDVLERLGRSESLQGVAVARRKCRCA